MSIIWLLCRLRQIQAWTSHFSDNCEVELQVWAQTQISVAPWLSERQFEFHRVLCFCLQYGGNDILQIYNTAQVKHRFNTTGLYIASTKVSSTASPTSCNNFPHLSQQSTYLVSLLHFSDISRTLRSPISKLCFVLKTKLTIGKRAFSEAVPAILNQLPFTIKFSETVDTFRKKLKTYLFVIAFPP